MGQQAVVEFGDPAALPGADALGALGVTAVRSENP
jgi:hypothetical protein